MNYISVQKYLFFYNQKLKSAIFVTLKYALNSRNVNFPQILQILHSCRNIQEIVPGLCDCSFQEVGELVVFKDDYISK